MEYQIITQWWFPFISRTKSNAFDMGQYEMDYSSQKLKINKSSELIIETNGITFLNVKKLHMTTCEYFSEESNCYKFIFRKKETLKKQESEVCIEAFRNDEKYGFFQTKWLLKYGEEQLLVTSCSIPFLYYNLDMRYSNSLIDEDLLVGIFYFFYRNDRVSTC